MKQKLWIMFAVLSASAVFFGLIDNAPLAIGSAVVGATAGWMAFLLPG
jgi:hypothetical protein